MLGSLLARVAISLVLSTFQCVNTVIGHFFLGLSGFACLSFLQLFGSLLFLSFFASPSALPVVYIYRMYHYRVGLCFHLYRFEK